MKRGYTDEHAQAGVHAQAADREPVDHVLRSDAKTDALAAFDHDAIL